MGKVDSKQSFATWVITSFQHLGTFVVRGSWGFYYLAVWS